MLFRSQALYPAGWVPSALAALPRFYVDMSADPLIGSAMGYFGPTQLQAYAWFRSFLMLEAYVPRLRSRLGDGASCRVC